MKIWFEKYRYWMKIPAMTFLGMIFLVSGVGKLLYDSVAFAPFPLIEGLPVAVNQMLFYALPYFEIAVGAMLIHGFMAKFATVVAGSALFLFLVNNIAMVSVGRGREPCQCFGMAGGMTYIDALVIDCIMAVLVAVIFICHRGGYFNIIPWFLDNETGIASHGFKVDMPSQR